MLLILAKLNNVDVFKTLIDSFRDESGKISDEVGLRSRMAPRSTETTYTPITVDVLCQGLSMVATEEAEYYLRDLSEDSSLEYGPSTGCFKVCRCSTSKTRSTAYTKNTASTIIIFNIPLYSFLLF